MTVLGTALPVAAASRGISGLITLVLLFGGGLAIVLFFFERRIGGAGGGSEKNIVGVVWLLAAIALGITLAHHR
jgi:hypothetical protein